MTVNVGDIVRITAVMNHSLEGAVENVWHCKQLNWPCLDTVFMAAAAAQLNTMYGYIDDYMPDTLDFIEVRGFNVTQTAPMVTFPWPTLVSGQVDVAHPLPSVMSVLMFTRTAVSRCIGRKFFGPFTEADQQDAEWGGGLLSALLTGMILWYAGWTSDPGNAYGGIYSPTDLQFYSALSSVVRAVPAYQRRRKRGRGD